MKLGILCVLGDVHLSHPVLYIFASLPSSSLVTQNNETKTRGERGSTIHACDTFYRTAELLGVGGGEGQLTVPGNEKVGNSMAAEASRGGEGGGVNFTGVHTWTTVSSVLLLQRSKN